MSKINLSNVPNYGKITVEFYQNQAPQFGGKNFDFLKFFQNISTNKNCIYSGLIELCPFSKFGINPDKIKKFNTQNFNCVKIY